MAVEVKTTAGVVRGAELPAPGEVHGFLGIPFAESPTGVNRFGAPVPVASWDGVRPCAAYGATAPQPAQGFTIIPEPIVAGDNCLNLNVFTPDVGADTALPVLVWIHGGGFVNGCNASPWYHGRSFGRDGVVVVAINYRLGIEGFLPLRDAPSNRALLDWLLALEWVHDNIASFGGDPGNVTIAGQSAGAVACATLLATPSAGGLFRRAILMSGSANHLRTVDEARPFAERLADELGVSATREAFARIDRDRIVAVQPPMGMAGDGESDEEGLATRFAARANGGLRFAPLIDGDLVPEPPLVALRTRARDKQVMLGTTAGETDAVAHLAGDLGEDALVTALTSACVSGPAARVYRAAHADDTPTAVLGHAMTDAMFRIPAVRMAEARNGTATFAYEFQWDSPTGFGSVHCLDLPFVFDVLDADAVNVVAGDDPPQGLADRMHGAWVRFITSGDPGWAPYDVERRGVMVFDDPASALVADPHAASRECFSGTRPLA
jgi:para-nitrobenzyl esterase